MPVAPRMLGPISTATRSRVTNHRDLLPDVDGRSIVARRYRDILAQICLDQGGIDQMSEARVQLARRFAACAVLAESMEARMANGEQIDIAEHSTLTSTMVRVAQRLGISRVAVDTVPSPLDFARRFDQRKESAV
jgi:hypothetical protein